MDEIKMQESLAWVNKCFTAETAATAIDYAGQCIRCEPYNPPGNEKKIAVMLSGILREAGFAVTLDEFAENRCNVVATYGNQDDIALILNGHMDVVPAFGKWQREPAGAQRENGILYGRGSCDMLGGCAAIVTAAQLIAAAQITPRRGIMVILVGDEEDKNRGIRHLLATRTLTADCAVIAEPTECEIHLGNRGFSSFYVKTTGIACHSSEPWKGENAIYKMGEVIRRLEHYANGLDQVTCAPLGQATACIGTIKGGVRLNTVPDECIIEVERRLLPGETAAQIHQQLQQLIGQWGEVQERTFFPASLIDGNHKLVAECRRILTQIQGKKPNVAVFRACTEASMFSVLCKIPTLLIGPGSLQQAHRINEFCKEQDIIDCAKLFAALIYYYIK